MELSVALGWVGVASAVAGLFALPPLAYRFFTAWWWPYSVDFRPYPGFGSGSQAGSPVQLLVDIRNRTPDPARFYLSAGFDSQAVGTLLPVTFWIADYPTNEKLREPIEVGPLGRRHFAIYVVPHRRGNFTFELSVTEFFHAERYPVWLNIRRRMLRMKSPELRPLDFAMTVRLSVDSWAIARERIVDWIGRPLTKEELDADDAYQREATARIG